MNSNRKEKNTFSLQVISEIYNEKQGQNTINKLWKKKTLLYFAVK